MGRNTTSSREFAIIGVPSSQGLDGRDKSRPRARCGRPASSTLSKSAASTFSTEAISPRSCSVPTRRTRESRTSATSVAWRATSPPSWGEREAKKPVPSFSAGTARSRPPQKEITRLLSRVFFVGSIRNRGSGHLGARVANLLFFPRRRDRTRWPNRRCDMALPVDEVSESRRR